MASVSYRLAQLGLDNSTLQQADIARHAVLSGVDTATGWLNPVVDPLDWSKEGRDSPEGQSFTLLLAASYRDYNNATGQTAPANGSGGSIGSGGSSSASPAHGVPAAALLTAFAMVAALTYGP